MSGTSTGIYGYRENANPDAFEMDNLRARVYETEKSIGELRKNRRFGIALAVLGCLSVVVCGPIAYGLHHKDEAPCKDTFVEAPTHGPGLSCPNSHQRMDEHHYMMPSPQSDMWGVRCLCVR